MKRRKKLEKTTDSRTYTILLKGTDEYCYICCKRAGVFGAYCAPRSRNRRRECRTWKHTRKTQYKPISH